MTEMLIDCAMNRPSIATMKARGATGVVRYITGRPWASINPTDNKDLFPAEAKALLDAGLSITLNYELNAEQPKGASAAEGNGVALRCERQADDLGYPLNCPIIYSVDYDAKLSEVINYLRGIQLGAKRPCGVYGSFGLIEAMVNSGEFLSWIFWQACAWSGFRVELGKPVDETTGNLSKRAHLFQHTIEIHEGGKDWDENRLIKDFPRWTKKATPPPPPPVPEIWWVDPAKVTTTLLGRDLAGKAKEGRALSPGAKVVGFPKAHPVTGRAVIVTADGISYAKDFLTATDPNVVIPPPVRPFPLVPVYTVKERIAFRNRRTCVCVATSLPWVEYRMLEAGVIQNNIDIAQMGYNAGGVAASAGTHDGGGNTDVGQYSEAALTIWREMGWTQQHRTPAQGFANHAHGWPKGCPHLSAGGRYQASEWEAGRNGLRGRGLITGPAPKGRNTPTWLEALAAYKRKVGATVTMADVADEFELEIYHDLPMPSGFDDGSNTPHS